MSVNQRKIGGANNKTGNRYEDFFALYKILEYAPHWIVNENEVFFKEQSGFHVDDFLVFELEDNIYHYFQLKADKTITWGETNGKLTNEFTLQKDVCEQERKDFTLSIVVADEDRETSLNNYMPEHLSCCTSVVLFPRLDRPTRLMQINESIHTVLSSISGSASPSVTEKEHIVLAFQIGWMESNCEDDGYHHLSNMVQISKSMGKARLYHKWNSEQWTEWNKAKEILDSISGLTWSVDRGYFEWSYPPTDQGLLSEPCESTNFQRFLIRLIEQQPNSFDEFEVLTP